ncbi:MAG TPA: rod shape-determining protein MreD [Chloroflexi bacterium]|nr:rod shape-determining protein MreD [Chloroflexota bacterium]
MSLYYGIPLLMLASILQSVWVEGLRVLGGRPDLALLLVVAWAVIRGADEGALWGFVAGVFCDLLSGSSFGLWTVMLTGVGLLAGQPWVQALGPTLVRLALMSGLGTVLAHLGLTTMMSLLGYPLNVGRALTAVAAPAALLNVLLSPFAFTFLVWVHRRLPRRGAG